jgi:hypothetical protein
MNFAGIELFKLRVCETTCSDIKRPVYDSFVLKTIIPGAFMPVKILKATAIVG